MVNRGASFWRILLPGSAKHAIIGVWHPPDSVCKIGSIMVVALGFGPLGFGTQNVVRSQESGQPYQLRLVDLPGVLEDSSSAIDITEDGQLLGSFKDAEGQHYFVLEAGELRVLRLPEGEALLPSSFNSHGAIAGTRLVELDPGTLGPSDGFVLEDDAFLPIRFPDAEKTLVHKINDDGQIVGAFGPGNGFTGPESGFIFDQDGYRPITVAGEQRTAATGISDSGGLIVGTTGPILSSRGFLDDGSTTTDIVFPGADSTSPSDVNDDGTVVGSYSVGLHSAEFRTQGFLFDGNRFATISLPTSLNTRLVAITEDGRIAGTAVFADGSERAFVGTVIPEPSVSVWSASAWLYLYAARRRGIV